MHRYGVSVKAEIWQFARSIGIFDESGIYTLYESNEKISINGIKTKQKDALKNELFYKEYPDVGKKIKHQMILRF